MYNLIVKRIKTNWIYYFLVLIGYVFSLLVISFGISFIKCSKEMSIEYTFGNINHKRVITATASESKKINYEKLVNILNKYAKNTSINLRGIVIEKPIDGRKFIVPIETVVFNETPEWIPKVVKGRYFNNKESMVKKNVAVVGTGIFLNGMLEKNGNVKIGDVEFKVIGQVGRLKDFSNYLGTIFIPASSLPDVLKNNLSSIEISMLKNNEYPKEEMINLSNDLKSILNLNVTEKEIKNGLSEFYTTLSTNTFVSFLILLVSVTNISVLIFYLMLKNKKNFIVSIALGAYKKIIWLQVFCELLVVSLCSVVIVTIGNRLLIPFVKSNLTNILNIESLTFNSFNIGISLLVSVLMSLLISTLSVRKFFKLDLITELKGE